MMPGSNDNQQNEDFGSDVPDLGDGIDMPTFSQILEMDEGDPERSFSKSLLMDFLTQAEETFDGIQEGLKAKDLKLLSEKGHYLKGSSATIGLVKVRDSCEKIQRYGKKENVDGSPEPNEELCLQRITNTFKVLRAEYKDVARELKRFFNVDEDEDDEDDGDDEADDEEEEKGQKDDAGESSSKSKGNGTTSETDETPKGPSKT